MPLSNRLHTIIHEAPNAILSAYTYTRVYASSGATPTINGTSIPLVAGTVLEDIVIKDITATAGIYLFGSPINTTLGAGGTIGSDQQL